MSMHCCMSIESNIVQNIECTTKSIYVKSIVIFQSNSHLAFSNPLFLFIVLIYVFETCNAF